MLFYIITCTIYPTIPRKFLEVVKMFSRFLTRGSSLCKSVGRSRIWRNTSQSSNASKREKNDSSLTLALILGISGPVCYCGYSYATDKLFHENMDEKYIYQWPWLYKHLNKWFPIEIDSPFGLRVRTVETIDK